DVAVRSSANAEDMPTASFAGQQETYLNVRGREDLIKACKRCLASLFTERAMSYRIDEKIDSTRVALSVGVQKMVRSDIGASGVMFTVDTETGFRDVVFINAAYGLGEFVVQGAVNPDEYYVFKPTLDRFRPVLSRKLGEKRVKLVYAKSRPTKSEPVPEKDRKRFVLNEDEILELARYAKSIEEYYSRKAGKWRPMDIEWAKDGKTGELFIVQARPETVQSQRDANVMDVYVMKGKGRAILAGDSVGNKIGAGKAKIIMDPNKSGSFKDGDAIITDMTDPDWEPLMKRAGAIVTERGGRTCFSGDTIVLTDRGFMKIKDIPANENVLVPSLNRETLKIEWKRVIAKMKRRAELIEVSPSVSGRMEGNSLRLTRDHKMLTFSGRKLIGKEIEKIIRDDEHVLIGRKLPGALKTSQREKNLAYFIGGLMTDGSIYKSRTHGEVQFIQKPTQAKIDFIEHMCFCLEDIFNKKFAIVKKKPSNGTIREKDVIGNSNAYRCYGKDIATTVLSHKTSIADALLLNDEEFSLNFLGGVVDGDGSVSGSRLNIYCSSEHLLQSIVIACMKIGTVPQVTTNRNIWNVQIVEKVRDITAHSKRLHFKTGRKRIGTRFFSARQILGDIIEHSNYKGRIRPYVNKNLMLDSDKLKNNVMPLLHPKEKEGLERILHSDTSMHRVRMNRSLGENDVYNITVEGNHNYIVFTDRYTPIIVNNCHAAIVSRELGIPCLIGTNNATRKIRDGQGVTVDCSRGEEGYVYDGILDFEQKKVNIKSIPRTRTKIMMNVGMPDSAFEQASIPNDGVGLAREEFIINSYIKVHPLALIDYGKIKDKKLKRRIDAITYGYRNKEQFFIDKLAEGVATIAAAFYPKDVIVRLSDFKSNEYAGLIGGGLYEPKEDNPMIGWRGASRYYSEKYRKAFALECKAMKKVREAMGLTNVKVMVPFCRTVEEGKKVIQEMEKNGLKQGKDGLEVYVMCEIPSNVVLADEFSKVFDGFSIGSNDLTQLTLGLDRDSELVSSIYDERNEAVKRLISQVIRTAKKNKRKIGICGQAPSDFPDFAQFLVKCGIDSISLNPDTVIKTTLKIAEEEKRLKKRSSIPAGKH
ncbi:MAG: phosphoenolpyruvate synthase, partial [Candidatus Aenigmatarchaeota archaeon]